MPRLKKTFITALDIGSTKTSCFISEILPENKLSIIGIGHQVSQGVKSGTITDIKLAENSIRSAVGAAEQMAGVNVDRIFVNISGCAQESHIVKADMEVAGHEISTRDIHRIIAQGCAQLQQDNNLEIIHCIPMDYSLDSMKFIKDPTGMRGKTLSAKMHVVTASATAINNLTACLARCHLDVEDYIISPYASAISCLNEDEKELGSILIDFGGGNSSIAIFKGGTMVFAGMAPLGGMHITSDIALGLATRIENAERAKTLYGSLIGSAKDEREIIDIPQIGDDGRSEMNNVERSTLLSIIKPRVEEIMEMVSGIITDAGYGNMGGNIVITGGASQLSGLKEMTSQIFQKQVRQGLPKKIEGMAESTKGPAFATCTGILLFALQKRNLASFDFMGRVEKFNNPLHKAVSWFKENF